MPLRSSSVEPPCRGLRLGGDAFSLAPQTALKAMSVAEEGAYRSRAPIPSFAAARHSRRFAYAGFFAGRPEAGRARVVGYGFRGDGRSPAEVRVAGGFWPMATTTEEIETPPLSLEAHSSQWPGSCYIGTARHATVARFFASRRKPTRSAWIYAMYIEGALDTQGAASGRFDYIVEYAMPGGVDWADVVAYQEIILSTTRRERNGRCCAIDGKGPIFVRRGFELIDPFACGLIVREMTVDNPHCPAPR